MPDLPNDPYREPVRETVVVQERPRKSIWRWLLPLLLLLALIIGYILLSPENEDAVIDTPDQVQIDTPNVNPPDVDVDAGVDVNRTEDGDSTAQ